MANPDTGELNDREVRLEALRLANSYRVMSGNGLGYSPRPSADDVVKRAEAYADFVLQQDKVEANGN